MPVFFYCMDGNFFVILLIDEKKRNNIFDIIRDDCRV